MRRSMAFFSMAMLALTATALAEDPAEAEARRLQGSWKVLAIEADGRKATAAEVEALQGAGWTFKGSQVTFGDENAPGRSSFKLDPARTPRQIDLVALDGNQKGKTMEGIYRLEGGTLTICLSDPGKGRPKTFATEAGTGQGLIVLEK